MFGVPGVLFGIFGVLFGVFGVLFGILGVLFGVLGVLFGVPGVLFGVFGVLFGVLGVWWLKGMRDSKEHMYTSNVWFGMSDSEGLIWDIQKYEETKGKCEEGKCGKEDRFWLVLSFKLC